MKAQKETNGCASNLLTHEDLGHFEEVHHWNIQAKFYNEKFPLVYESDNIGDSLSHEDHCATLKHKCGKRIVTLSLLSFSLNFFIWAFLSFLWPLFFRPESHPDLWGNHSLHHPFLTWDIALIMEIITLLFIYNSRITTQYLGQYDSM